MADVRLYQGDCLQILPTLDAGSVDAVITDPPYPEIDRPYGRMTEAEWFAMMRAVVPECMRILKPTGSAVFVLQPNSERLGRMRTWLWKFMAWVGDEWGIVQDVYWWNLTSLPTVHTSRDVGLMRGSVKGCVWVGANNCFRDQNRVLWKESDANRTARSCANSDLKYSPSGISRRDDRCRGAALDRGGVTPFNLLPIPNPDNSSLSSAEGHSAVTPQRLCDWWTRYICPPGGIVLDPFMGSGTSGLAALKYGCGYVGIEKMSDYFAIAKRRIDAAQAEVERESAFFAGAAS